MLDSRSVGEGVDQAEWAGLYLALASPYTSQRYLSVRRFVKFGRERAMGASCKEPYPPSSFGRYVLLPQVPAFSKGVPMTSFFGDVHPKGVAAIIKEGEKCATQAMFFLADQG